jgi:predicted tellurium resistance membrane protein TerC
MLSKLMDRYPIILWVGAAVLGRVGGEMMITDPWIHGLLQPPTLVAYSVEAFFVIFVCGLAKILMQRQAPRGLAVASIVEREPAM